MGLRGSDPSPMTRRPGERPRAFTCYLVRLRAEGNGLSVRDVIVEQTSAAVAVVRAEQCQVVRN